MNTKQVVFSNLLWRFAERVGAQLVQFVVSIVLARILAPEAYGTIALVTVFITILQVFIDNGLGNALIQKKNADNTDFSTVFFTNIIFCAILYAILFFCAPLVSTLYNDPNLTSITRVLGLTIPISGIKNIQQAYVARQMLFKRFFFATLGGTISAAGIGIWMALNGFGVWALITQQLTNATIDTIILWLTVRWRPERKFSFSRLKSLFSYGWKLLTSAMLETIYNNIQQLLIGKLYNTDDLAYYNRGRNLPELIIINVNSSIDSVIFPTMSAQQNNIDKIKNIARRTIKISTFILTPLMLGLAFTANNLISVLLTDKWLPCVPYIIIFSVIYALWPIHTVNLNVIKSLGRSDIYLKLEIIKKIIGVIFLIVAIPVSPIAIAVSLLFTDLISQIINTYPNRKLINYGYIKQLIDIAPNVILAIVMGLAVYLYNFCGWSPLTTLIAQVATGAIIYIGGAAVLRFDSLFYTIDLIKNIMHKDTK